MFVCLAAGLAIAGCSNGTPNVVVITQAAAPTTATQARSVEDVIRSGVPEMANATDAQIDAVLTSGCELIRATDAATFLQNTEDHGLSPAHAVFLAQKMTEAYCPDLRSRFI
jgi:hypothetical protein